MKVGRNATAVFKGEWEGHQGLCLRLGRRTTKNQFRMYPNPINFRPTNDDGVRFEIDLYF